MEPTKVGPVLGVTDFGTWSTLGLAWQDTIKDLPLMAQVNGRKEPAPVFVWLFGRPLPPMLGIDGGAHHSKHKFEPFE